VQQAEKKTEHLSVEQRASLAEPSEDAIPYKNTPRVTSMKAPEPLNDVPQEAEGSDDDNDINLMTRVA
jgi:hypothetical protein